MRQGGTVNLNGGSYQGAFFRVFVGGRVFVNDQANLGPTEFTIEGGEFVMEFGTYNGSIMVGGAYNEDTGALLNRGRVTIFDGNFTGQLNAQGDAFIDITGGVFSAGSFTRGVVENPGRGNFTMNIAGSNIIPSIFFDFFTSSKEAFIFQGTDFRLGG